MNNNDQGNIVIVDDNPNNLQVLSGILQQAGYKVRPALSGEIALRAIAMSAPDLVLLDIRMPGMDGYETCRRLQGDTLTRDIPVIFISALTETSDKLAAFRAGGVDYVSKPFQAEEVLARVSTHAALHRARRQLYEREQLLQRNLAQLEVAHTTLKERGSQLQQSEKMAAIGQLAAGVAHEINNPIGFVNSNLGSLQRYLVDLFNTLAAYEQVEAEFSPETRASLAEMKRKADLSHLRQDSESLLTESLGGMRRVKRIVQDLKDFAQVDETDKQWANLEKGMDSTLNVVWNELKYKAEVIKEYAGIADIECIPSQINQVFMNLLINAAQAIDKHGRITVRTGQEDQQVWVEVQDTGTGIKSEHLSRIFDPFFTTKPVGKGTGLGLSMSYGIVKKHNGRIEVQSEEGEGARFRVWLPITQSIQA